MAVEMRVLIERVRWSISVELERPSNYGRRCTLKADDVLRLIEIVEESALTTKEN